MKGQRMSFIMVWKVVGELHSLKNMMSGSKSPWFMEKAAFHSSPSLRQTLLKPQRRSKVVNHSVSHNLVSTSETNRSRKERSEEHTPELQSPTHLVCRLLLETKSAHK